MFPHLDVFVYEDGYGGVIRRMQHGVPLMMALYRLDHPDTGVRLERYGNGVNMKTGNPEPDKIRSTVMWVLEDTCFKEKAVVLRKQMLKLDCMEIVEECIEELMLKGS